MTTITKKQASLAFVIAVFAVIMFAGPVAFNSSVNSAFVYGKDFFFNNHHHHHFFFHQHHNGKHSSIHQSINQRCDQNQRSTVLSAGAGSPIVGSGNNIAACANVNFGGNAAVTNQ